MITEDILRMILMASGALLLLALVVFVVELVRTLSRVRKTIDELQPTVEKVNGAIEALEPALKRVDPLMERVSLTVDALNLELMRADQILADISDVTNTASGTVKKVSNIADAPLSLLTSATDKVRNIFAAKKGEKGFKNSLKAAEATAVDEAALAAGELGAGATVSESDAVSAVAGWPETVTGEPESAAAAIAGKREAAPAVPASAGEPAAAAAVAAAVAAAGASLSATVVGTTASEEQSVPASPRMPGFEAHLSDEASEAATSVEAATAAEAATADDDVPAEIASAVREVVEESNAVSTATGNAAAAAVEGRSAASLAVDDTVAPFSQDAVDDAAKSESTEPTRVQWPF